MYWYRDQVIEILFLSIVDISVDLIEMLDLFSKGATRLYMNIIFNIIGLCLDAKSWFQLSVYLNYYILSWFL